MNLYSLGTLGNLRVDLNVIPFRSNEFSLKFFFFPTRLDNLEKNEKRAVQR